MDWCKYGGVGYACLTWLDEPTSLLDGQRSDSMTWVNISFKKLTCCLFGRETSATHFSVNFFLGKQRESAKGAGRELGKGKGCRKTRHSVHAEERELEKHSVFTDAQERGWKNSMFTHSQEGKGKNTAFGEDLCYTAC